MRPPEEVPSRRRHYGEGWTFFPVKKLNKEEKYEEEG
jgi:hypothetical protein